MKNHSELEAVARSLVPGGKGILAADESSGTIKKRFDSIGLESTEENRRAYREILFTSEGIERFISGVILYDETIRQSASNGVPFPKLLASKGILPGIKVDEGKSDLPGFPGESVTVGLDGLPKRLPEYVSLGARFTKWRAVIAIGPGIPTAACLRANGHALARYAALSQRYGLVPIVEPEVLMDGDNDIDVCFEVTSETLRITFQELHEQRVSFEGMLLKPNMVIAGKKCPRQAGVSEVAEKTLRCLRRHVPASVPGIVFLSGGQNPQQATEHLNAMNAIGGAPWELSFSYGRALQEPVLKAWGGRPENSGAARKAFFRRAELNGAARQGRYRREMESIAV